MHSIESVKQEALKSLSDSSMYPRLPDPAVLYKQGENPVKVYRIDMPGWLAQGWSETPEPVCEVKKPSVQKEEAKEAEVSLGKEAEAKQERRKVSTKLARVDE